MDTWRRTAASGFIVLLPILVCGYLVTLVYQRLVQVPILGGVQPPILRGLLILLVFAMSINLVGYLMRTVLGQLIDQRIDEAVGQFPGVRMLHRGLKGAIETVVRRQDIIRDPIKVKVWNGLHMTAFRTGNRTQDGQEIVFVPGAPDVTSGFVVEVGSEDIIETDEQFMDALVRLLSCGFGDATTDSSQQNHVQTFDD